MIAEEAAMADSSSAAPSASPFEFDVFLSFQGEDTRRTFTDHLYHGLSSAGVRVFRDGESLQKGGEISVLFETIERSEIFIPVFSKNYADSRWCLREIEKIVRVAMEGQPRRTILPVFYGIEPGVVRHQTGPFEEAFRKHAIDEKGVHSVKGWREALRRAAEFSGYGTEKMAYG